MESTLRPIRGLSTELPLSDCFSDCIFGKPKYKQPAEQVRNSSAAFLKSCSFQQNNDKLPSLLDRPRCARFYSAGQKKRELCGLKTVNPFFGESTTFPRQASQQAYQRGFDPPCFPRQPLSSGPAALLSSGPKDSEKAPDRPMSAPPGIVTRDENRSPPAYPAGPPEAAIHERPLPGLLQLGEGLLLHGRKAKRKTEQQDEDSSSTYRSPTMSGGTTRAHFSLRQ